MSPKLRALAPALLAAAYVVFLVWQAPHTVHHFFERDAEKPNECALSASADRSSGATPAPVGLVPVAGVDLAVVPSAADAPARAEWSVLGARAPPSPIA